MEDGEWETAVIFVDLGVVQGNDPDGRMVSAVFDRATGSLNLDWFGAADQNDRVLPCSHTGQGITDAEYEAAASA